MMPAFVAGPLLVFAMFFVLAAGTRTGPANPLLTVREEHLEWSVTRWMAFVAAALAFAAGWLL